MNQKSLTYTNKIRIVGISSFCMSVYVQLFWKIISTFYQLLNFRFLSNENRNTDTFHPTYTTFTSPQPLLIWWISIKLDYAYARNIQIDFTWDTHSYTRDMIQFGISDASHIANETQFSFQINVRSIIAIFVWLNQSAIQIGIWVKLQMWFHYSKWFWIFFFIFLRWFLGLSS